MIFELIGGKKNQVYYSDNVKDIENAINKGDKDGDTKVRIEGNMLYLWSKKDPSRGDKAKALTEKQILERLNKDYDSGL